LRIWLNLVYVLLGDVKLYSLRSDMDNVMKYKFGLLIDFCFMVMPKLVLTWSLSRLGKSEKKWGMQVPRTSCIALSEKIKEREKEKREKL
jgi:hypothetical protein